MIAAADFYGAMTMAARPAFKVMGLSGVLVAMRIGVTVPGRAEPGALWRPRPPAGRLPDRWCAGSSARSLLRRRYAEHRVSSCDWFERLDRRPVVDGDVCPGTRCALEVAAQDRSALVYVNFVQHDRFPVTMAQRGVPP